MRTRSRRSRACGSAVAATLVACFLLPSTAGAVSTPNWVSEAPEWASDAGPVAFDAIVLRPLGFIATTIGLGFFVPAAIFTAPMGKRGVQDAWNRLVDEQASYTFTREWGEF